MGDIFNTALKPNMPPYAFSLPDRRSEKKRRHWQCAPHRLLSLPLGLPLITRESVCKANYSSRPSAVKQSKTPTLSPCGEEPQSTRAPESLRGTHADTHSPLCVCNCTSINRAISLHPLACFLGSAGVRKMHQIKQPL